MKEVIRHSTVLNCLLSNCKQSDREIAKKANVSQPTVTRIRTRLEKVGIIKAYMASLTTQNWVSSLAPSQHAN